VADPGTGSWWGDDPSALSPFFVPSLPSFPCPSLPAAAPLAEIQLCDLGGALSCLDRPTIDALQTASYLQVTQRGQDVSELLTAESLYQHDAGQQTAVFDGTLQSSVTG